MSACQITVPHIRRSHNKSYPHSKGHKTDEARTELYALKLLVAKAGIPELRKVSRESQCMLHWQHVIEVTKKQLIYLIGVSFNNIYWAQSWAETYHIICQTGWSHGMVMAARETGSLLFTGDVTAKWSSRNFEVSRQNWSVFHSVNG